MFSSLFTQRRWDPAGLHCYVTGGSSGLGLSLALLLTKHGAHVSIVARNRDTLAHALAQLEGARVSPKQVLASYSYSLETLDGAQAAYNAACATHDGTPADAVFMCAGGSRPGFWVEQSEEQIRHSMDITYWVAAWTAKVAAERMARTRHSGKFVFVGSILSYFGLVGYATYCPGKFAIRGLAETLRQEMLLYGVDVHMYFPATIDSPGLVEENKSKPALTLKIEESDPVASPDACAAGLFQGVQRGDFHIADTFNAEAFRATTRGTTPWNSFGKDMLYGFIGSVALPFWRRDVDDMVRKHRDEHAQYLEDRGFFRQSESRD
ncbi:oxidoreductase [Peniophora sp. CONT]|nr:oxidoreductase [Peniophora sp. CONT]